MTIGSAGDDGIIAGVIAFVMITSASRLTGFFHSAA